MEEGAGQQRDLRPHGRMREVREQPDYMKPGIWIRIQHRFRTRMTEWMLAAMTAALGVVLLLPGALFNEPRFAGFREMFGNEMLLGGGMLLFGNARIIGLIVNGARQNVTPHIRVVSAGFGCLVFSGMCYCYAFSGIVDEWLAFYPILVATEIVNIYRAAHDVGESHGRAH